MTARSVYRAGDEPRCPASQRNWGLNLDLDLDLDQETRGTAHHLPHPSSGTAPRQACLTPVLLLAPGYHARPRALTTLQAAALSMGLSLVISVALVTLRLRLRRARFPVIRFIELFLGLPVIVTILLVAVLLPRIGIDIPNFRCLMIGLAAYNSVIISEILRAGVLSLPRGQVEAGLAIGLTRRQTMALVEMPQAFRIMLPALISQLVVIVKDTALASVVINGVDDLLRQAQALRVFLENPLQVFAVVAVIYIVLNVLLDRVAVLVERRVARRRA